MRYYRLLPPNGWYSEDFLSVQTNSAEESIMSAQSFMAGFIPPSEKSNKLSIPWQPFHMKIISETDDILIGMNKSCEKYDDKLERYLRKPKGELKELSDKNQNLFKLLSKNTGDNISNIHDVDILYKILSIEYNAGLQLPNWTHNVFPNKLFPLAKRSEELLTETDYMKKVKGGPLISEIMDNIVKKRLGILFPNRNVFIYSGLDVTLINVIRALRVYDQISGLPNYSSALAVKLHQSLIFNESYEVRVRINLKICTTEIYTS